MDSNPALALPAEPVAAAEGVADLKAPEAAPAPEAQAATTRDVTLRVPVTMPDQRVNFAIQLAMNIDAALHSGHAMFVFPIFRKNAQGQDTLAAGKQEIPILNEKDINRIGTLCEVVIKANMAVLDAARKGNAADELTARVEGEKIKENAARDQTSKATGQAGGILVPSGAHV